MDILYMSVLIQYHCCHSVLVFTFLGVLSLLSGILSTSLLLIVLNFPNKEAIIVTIQCLIYSLENNKHYIRAELHQKAVVQIFTVYFDFVIS